MSIKTGRTATSGARSLRLGRFAIGRRLYAKKPEQPDLLGSGLP
jgi:hypothetical protein